MMPEVSGSSADVKQNELGPNYLGYYKHEIGQIFSQNEDLPLPSTSKDSESSVRTWTDVKVEDGSSNYRCRSKEAKSYRGSVSLFNAGVGEGLSDFKKEKLEVSLRQSVKDLNREVDEILDHALAIHKVQTHQGERYRLFCCAGGLGKETGKHLCKKQKLSSPTVSNNISRDAGSAGLQSLVSRSFQSLLESYEVQSEEALRRSSSNLLAKLEYMEQHLEEFLDTVTSRCRVMTLIEKHQLCKRIQKLPAKALDRLVEIIKHRKPSERHASDELHVDLEEEDNTTLWRLHYYVEAVEIANELK